MGEIRRCPCCLGRKKLIGFGFMEETCTECKGVGSIEDKDEVTTVVAEVVPAVISNVVDPIVVDNEIATPVKKRPGRAIGATWKKVKE